MEPNKKPDGILVSALGFMKDTDLLTAYSKTGTHIKALMWVMFILKKGENGKVKVCGDLVMQ